MSVPDAIGRTLKELTLSQMKDKVPRSTNVEICPECGAAALIKAEGCSSAKPAASVSAESGGR